MTTGDPLAERQYEPVIGLEIHVQLRTRTKMFCGCALSFGDEPNTHTCPICLGHPGTLPVTNAEAVHFGLMIAMALECEVAPRSIFHRKNYFYPDLPKGYQISQYDIPLGSTGRLGDVRVHRVHLEEDAAKLVHAGASGRIHSASDSVVDFNRGGTPLVEIVSEPDLRSASEAAEWARLLRATLKRLGVSDVNMEEGSLRVDANVSIRPAGDSKLGTKTELKNMNSFRFLERGIDAELRRQEEIVRGGGEVEQETLHYDPSTGALTSLRSKEEAHDYRYFPEPDLVPLAPTEEMLSRARDALPELPAARAERFAGLGLSPDHAKLLAFRGELGDFFEAALESNGGTAPVTVANWVAVELVPRLGSAEPSESKVEPKALAELVALIDSKSISQSAAKEVLDVMAEQGGHPAAIVEERSLGLAGADELEGIVDRALEANPKAVEELKAGKQKAVGAIVGFVMRETKGRADGGEVNRLIRQKLGV
jgi:aspartyl-tRNA(Asn)/glutamyl-tRNA(Gln) amidotransferase subunit B